MKTPALSALTDYSWEAELAASLRTADDLVQEGFISPAEKQAYQKVLSKYRFLLPRYYASLIDKSDPHCPIRRQAIPDLSELLVKEGFTPDPLADFDHRPESRITHRYEHRVLLHLTPNCSMYCRFCFRKTLLNDARNEFFDGELAKALDFIRNQKGIEEVIFSGGDPFLANERQLQCALNELDDMSHVQRIRFHTRVPVTLPRRVTPLFADRMGSLKKTVIVVNHFNHPKEVTCVASQALGLLRGRGITLLNQSVLLAGVNDSAEVLADLSRKLMAEGTLPYYLHHPDPSSGTAHFDLPVAKGWKIWRELKKELPGYLVPRYVIDDVKRPYKSDVALMSESEIQSRSARFTTPSSDR